MNTPQQIDPVQQHKVLWVAWFSVDSFLMLFNGLFKFHEVCSFFSLTFITPPI